MKTAPSGAVFLRTFGCRSLGRPHAGPKLQGMNTPSATNACLCPLCGQPNRCAMEQPQAGQHEPCWCTREQFGAALLQQVPEALRGRACICQACVQASRAQP